MAALVAVETVVIVLLVVLVTGLLRSHADILRALEELGVGLGDPSDTHGRTSSASAAASFDATPRRSDAAAAAVTGPSPSGDAVAVSVGGDVDTLFAFLTSGCTTCRSFWETLSGETDLPEGLRVVIVTAGSEEESVSRVNELASAVTVPVVMSGEAWRDYQVPRAPYFVLVEAGTGRIAGEGSAPGWGQVVELVERARDDEGSGRSPAQRARDEAARRQVDAMAHDRDREARNDEELLRAGIEPGDPRLHFPVDGDPPRTG